MKTHIRRGILLILLLLAPITAVRGKVFWKRLADDAVSAFDKAGRWSRVYRCQMAINGAPAALAVYKCSDPLAAAAAGLGDPGGAGGFEGVSAGQDSALFTSEDGNRSARLLLLGLPGRDESVIFELIRNRNDKPAPAAAMVPESALPAACSRAGTMVNADTGTTLESITSALPPRQAFSLLAEYLAGQGWQSLLPDANHGAAEQCFGVFQRKNSLCLLTAGRALRENKTCVTIISKEINRP